MKKQRKNNLLNIKVASTIDQKVLLQRLIMLAAGILLFYATYYGHNITSQRIDVLRHGKMARTLITRISSKRTIKTVYVTIDGLECDAGDPLTTNSKGDSILVHYKPNVKYVVPVGRQSFMNMVVFQYLSFLASFVVLAVAFFYPHAKIVEYIEKRARKG